LAAAGWGAFVFVFACPFDEPLYVAVWYSLGCGAVTPFASLIVPRLTRGQFATALAAFRPSHKSLLLFCRPTWRDDTQSLRPSLPTPAAVGLVGKIAITGTPSCSAVTIPTKFSKTGSCVIWRTDRSELEDDACLHV
jgi:hypothetical protein